MHFRRPRPTYFRPHRLEAATSRLEDLAQHNGGQVAQPATTNEALPTPPSDVPKGPAVEGVAEDPRTVKLFDEQVVKGKLEPWVQLSHTLGGPVDEQVVGHDICGVVLAHGLRLG